jgi:hypothetical protein
MSSIFSKNEKEFAGIRVVDSQDVWVINGKRKFFNPNVDVVGKVEISIPNFVLKANRENHPTAFIEDVSALPRRAKQDIVNHFYSVNGKRSGKTVAFLIRTDSKSKTKDKERFKKPSKPQPLRVKQSKKRNKKRVAILSFRLSLQNARSMQLY